MRRQKSNNVRWRDKGDKLLREYSKGQRCAVCNTDQHVCLHHLLPKSRFGRYRFELWNLIPLCPTHHTMGSHLSAHNENLLCVERFWQFLKERYPTRLALLRKKESQYMVSTIHWEDLYKKLVKDLKKVAPAAQNVLDKPSTA